MSHGFGWLKVFPRNRIDHNILDLYLEIELLIIDIDEKLLDYFRYLISSGYYKSKGKDKSYHSIRKIDFLFKKIKADYAFCYTIRKDKKHYNFGKNMQARAEKLEIESALKEIKFFLEKIESHVKRLSLIKLKSNNLEEASKDIERQLHVIEQDVKKGIRKEHIFRKIKETDEHTVFDIINKIVHESRINRNKGLWLISQKDKKTKLLFSCTLPISKVKYLELVPVLELQGLKKRSLYINELHKDAVLPVYHYNLDIHGDNIHVIPSNYKKKVEQYLNAA